MEKIKLIEEINNGLTQRQIANLYNVSQSTIKHWLKKYKIKTQNKRGKKPLTKKCLKCNETSNENFYGKQKQMCKKCSNEARIQKTKKIREYILNKMGNCCYNCGFSKYKSALEIHHIDPSTKDKKYTSIKTWSIKKIDKELEKCVLLCSNCHSAVHGQEIQLQQV